MLRKNSEFKFCGQTALITGSGRRIGRSIALTLAQYGMNIACHYGQSKHAAEEVVNTCWQEGVQAGSFQADLDDHREVEKLMGCVRSKLGPVHILINNASIFEKKAIQDTDIERWRRHMNVNLNAPFILSREFACQKDLDTGNIINMLDWRGLRPAPDYFAYTISKAGLAALTENLAIALAPTIRVNGLALGAILPPPGVEEKKAKHVKDYPLKRWSNPEEVCRAILFLLNDATSTTGDILHLDGGRHLI